MRTNAQRARYRVKNNVPQKHCPGCNTWKHVDDFYPGGGANRRYSSRCKRCRQKEYLLKRNGTTVNGGYITFSSVERYLRVVIKNTPTKHEAARKIGISYQMLCRYLREPPLRVQKRTAARFMYAVQKIKQEKHNGADS
jgi:hypothetical protein